MGRKMSLNVVRLPSFPLHSGTRAVESQGGASKPATGKSGMDEPIFPVLSRFRAAAGCGPWPRRTMFHGAECEWTAPRRLRPVHRTLSDVQAFYPQGTQKDLPGTAAACLGDRAARYARP